MNGRHFLIVGGLWLVSLGCATAQDWYVTDLPARNWTGIAVSSNGTTIVAVNGTSGPVQGPGGEIWVSTNSGRLWWNPTVPDTTGRPPFRQRTEPGWRWPVGAGLSAWEN